MAQDLGHLLLSGQSCTEFQTVGFNLVSSKHCRHRQSEPAARKTGTSVSLSTKMKKSSKSAINAYRTAKENIHFTVLFHTIKNLIVFLPYMDQVKSH